MQLNLKAVICTHLENSGYVFGYHIRVPPWHSLWIRQHVASTLKFNIKRFPLKMFHLPHIYVDSQKITNDLCYEDEDLDTRANVVKSSNKYLQKTKLLL